MNTLTNLYKINGKALFAPDENVSMSFEDLEASDTGMDEGGFLHRIVVRHKVGTWSFYYSHISQEEYAYMLSLLPLSGSFTFTHPKLTDCAQTEDTAAYCSKYSIVWHSAKTKDYRNFKFDIIEC